MRHWADQGNETWSIPMWWIIRWVTSTEYPQGYPQIILLYNIYIYVCVNYNDLTATEPWNHS